MPQQKAGARRRAGRALAEALKRSGLSIKLVSRETGIDPVTLSNLAHSALQLRTIDVLGAFLQQEARSRLQATQQKMDPHRTTVLEC